MSLFIYIYELVQRLQKIWNFWYKKKLSQPVHTDMHLIIIKLFSNLKKGLYLYEQNSISGMFVFTNLLSSNIKQNITKHLQKW